MLTTINIITYSSITIFQNLFVPLNFVRQTFQNYFRIFFTSPFNVSPLLYPAFYLNSPICSNTLSTLQTHIYHFTVRTVLRSINPPPLLFRPCFEQSLTTHCECWWSIIYARNDSIRDKSRRIPLNQSRSPVPNEL